MGGQDKTADQILARIAAHQHGLVTRAQLLAAGVSRREIERRVERGSLIPVHRGVYRVGHAAPTTESTYLAAVLACGPGALLMGAAAAHLYGLIKGAPPGPSVLTPTERRVEGVATERSRRIDPREATRWQGIPITTVPRTLVDLAAEQDEDDLARACHEAGVRFRTTPRQVETVLKRHPNAKGSLLLRAVVRGEVRVTLSRLEERFLELLEKNALPLPTTNKPAGTKRVDCRWPEHRLTVELDSYRFHSSRHAWEQDRRREREAYARGDDFRRYTWNDVFREPGPMLGELVPLLYPKKAAASS